VTLLRERSTALVPAGDTVRGRAIREILLVAVLFLAYQAGRILAAGHVSGAMANATRLWDLERTLRLPDESALQHLVIHRHLLVRAADSYYAYVHFPATVLALVWMYLRHPDRYRWMRWVLAGLTAAALVVHVLIPLAPPRMLPLAGLVDTGRVYGPAVYGSPDSDPLSNQFAAMPSLHVGWALAVAVAIITATHGRWRWLWLAHPLLTLTVVVATGNHYWLDAIVAVAILAVVFLLVPRPAAGPRPITRPRPRGARRFPAPRLILLPLPLPVVVPASAGCS
jgi:PAP2 superfamily protein